MIHLAGGASTWPDRAQLVVVPECAVKQNDIAIMNSIAEFVGDLTDRGCNQHACPGNFVTELKRNAIAQFKRAKSDAGAQGKELAVCRSPFNPGERLQDNAEPTERGLSFVGRVNHQRHFLLSHQYETESVIGIGIC